MINLKDPRWQAIGVLLAVYTFAVAGLLTIPAAQTTLFHTKGGYVLVAILLLGPAILLAILYGLRILPKRQLSKRDKHKIETLLNSYKDAWINACYSNEPRHLWNLTTKSMYFELEAKILECHQRMRRTSCQEIKLNALIVIAIEGSKSQKVTLRTDENWSFIYKTGQEVAKEVSNLYTIIYQDNHWKISDVKQYVPIE